MNEVVLLFEALCGGTRDASVVDSKPFLQPFSLHSPNSALSRHTLRMCNDYVGSIRTYATPPKKNPPPSLVCIVVVVVLTRSPFWKQEKSDKSDGWGLEERGSRRRAIGTDKALYRSL